jgi:hypothetical protein
MVLDAPNGGQGRRRPAFDIAAMMFARLQSCVWQTIVEIGEASSGFLQFVAMGAALIDAATFSPPSRPVAGSRGRRPQIQNMAGSTYRSLATC